MINGRRSDAFYFLPTINLSKKEIAYEHQKSKSYIVPGPDGKTKIKEIHKTVYSPQKFNENGIIREKRNYTLYENKNWTENVKYPIIEYEKIDIPKPKPKPKIKAKPKPNPMPKIEKEFEVVREEIEREEDKKKKLLKSNYIRKDDRIKKKKYKFKKINYSKGNYIRENDKNYKYR